MALTNLFVAVGILLQSISLASAPLVSAIHEESPRISPGERTEQRTPAPDIVISRTTSGFPTPLTQDSTDERAKEVRCFGDCVLDW
jgi:hypothetical protein